MNRGSFQALSSSSNEQEFSFWLEEHHQHTEVLSLLVERYANDIYQLGYIWFYDAQPENPEKFIVDLFTFVQDVFTHALETISDFNGQGSAGIWLYGIAIQIAKRRDKKSGVWRSIVFRRQVKRLRFLHEGSETKMSFTEKLEQLLPHQRLIIALRHIYQIDMSLIAVILRQDISFIQYELSTVRQVLFEAPGTSINEQKACSDPDFKYTLQAYHDGLLYNNDHMPLELENHLSECSACNNLKDNLVKLGELLAGQLTDNPFHSPQDLSDHQYLLESMENSTGSITAKSRRAISFFRQAFVTIAVLLAIAVFSIQNFIQDTHRGVPLFPPTPTATPTAFVQLSDLFRVISVDQAQNSRQDSIYNDNTPGIILSMGGSGYCSETTDNGLSWLPPGKCLEMSNNKYSDWISSNDSFKWFYSGFNGPVKHLKSLVFSPDGNVLAGLSIDSHIHFWQAETGHLLNTMKLNQSVTSELAYSPDGNQISFGLQNGTITTITDLENMKIALENFSGPVFSLDYSSDGKSLIVGEKGIAWGFGLSGEKKVVLNHYPFPGNRVVSLDFSPNGKTLAFGLDDGTIWLYRFEDATFLARLNGHSGKVTHIAFAPGGGYLASGATDGNVTLWDISEISSTTKLYEIKHPDWIIGLDFSSNGSMIATASLGGEGNRSGVYLWSVSEGNLLDMVPNDGLFTAGSIAFSPNGESLAIGSTTGSVKLWKIPRDILSIERK